MKENPQILEYMETLSIHNKKFYDYCRGNKSLPRNIEADNSLHIWFREYTDS